MLRISTSQFFQTAVTQINAQQSQLLGLYDQVSSGKRITHASDDPMGAARAVSLAFAKAANTQYAANRSVAEQRLNTEEGTLQSVTTLMQTLQTEIVHAGSDTLSDNDRQAIGAVVTTLRQQLVGLANATDANGQYLFSGSHGNVAPFQPDPATGAITWVGDDATRLAAASATREIATNDSGRALFMEAAPGDVGYVSSAGNNQGTGVITSPALTGGSTDQSYRITFDGAGQYTVTTTDAAGQQQTGAAQPYAPGQMQLSSGVSVAFAGQPAAGDTFVVARATAPQAGLDLFASLGQLADALNTPAGADPSALAGLHNTLNAVAQRVQLNYNAILTVRASLGTRLGELSSLDDSGQQLDSNYTQQLSGVEDVDYNSAVTALSLRQTALAAAQQAFVSIQGLNLFATNSGR